MKTINVLLIDSEDAPQLLPSANTAKGEQFLVTRKPTLLQGLDALQQSTFDVVLLSLSLSHSAAAESITRTIEMARGSAVIALVNEGERTKAVGALGLGAYGYVFKGCRCDCLIQTIRHAMERKQLIAGREHARRPAAENAEQLAFHLGNKSHQLRNALACIRQFGNILIDGLAGKLSDEQREYVAIMLENTSTIRTVLDSTLDGRSGPLGDPTGKIARLSHVGN
jgi:DNA-binding NtrC family response regulator